MVVRTVDSRPGGKGDLVVALWIAEGARAVGDRIGFVDGRHSEVVLAFGHELVDEPSVDCMGLGIGTNTFEAEFATAADDRTPRVARWQRTVGWDYVPTRPRLVPLPEEVHDWARAMRDDRPLVVIAPRANIGSRSLPMEKWLRVAWSLERSGIRTVAIDGDHDAVSSFPFYAFGFGWANVLALLQEADVVAGNDSGIAHLAATLGVRTVVAMGPTDTNVVFGHCLDEIETVVDRSVPCLGCHYMGQKGFQIACDHGCEALQTLPWQSVREAIVVAVADRTGRRPSAGVPISSG